MRSALVYEWRRLWSVRSTWVMSLLYVVMAIILGAVPLYLDSGAKQSWIGLYSSSGNLLCLIMLSVVAAQTFGHEYRYGLIRLTLSEFPKRERVMIAKTVILAFYVAIMTIVGWSVLGAVGATKPSRMSADVVGFSMSGSGLPHLWQVPVFGFAYCIIAMSVTVLTRNLALGVILPLLSATLIESLITGFASLAKGRWDWLVHILPFNNASAWMDQSTELHFAGLIFASWVIGFYFLATLRFHLRDA
ncbi:MAG: hypothetical protein WCO64_00025 [Actinomycetes bacterium]